MFGFGMPEVVIIGVILLLIFGPGKLPQVGSALGGAIRSFKSAAEEKPLPDGIESVRKEQ